MKINYSYHNHTYLCGHATGEMAEYVQNAIDCGIIHMGFSDHAPYHFDNVGGKGTRMTNAQAKEYVAQIRRLREMYKGKIDILIGFELEYYPEKFESMLEYIKSLGAEYIILGQHYMRGIYTGGYHVIDGKATEEDLTNYVKDLICAMESGVFTYIAHPDMIKFLGDEALYEKEVRKLCIASKRTGIPLEINGQGIRENRAYPAERFWKIAGEVGSPVTVGFDSHSAEVSWESTTEQRAQQIIDKFNLNYIGEPKIIRIDK